MKWKTLQHNGILFPPAYEAHGIKIKIKGESVDLDLNQEEMIYQWAKKKDTPYAQDKVFQKNFTQDFAKTLQSKFKNISYQDIDFSHAYKIVDKEKDLREMMTKEEKKALSVKRKELREKLVQKYGKAIMDGKEVDVANYMAEPPGIFIGRGDHPLRGRWKPRVTTKDVTLNLGKEAKIPEGDWGKIVHDNDSMWLAGWTDYLTEKVIMGVKMMAELGTPPSEVAKVILNEIKEENPRPRYIVGNDAQMFLEAKKSKTDTEFENYLKKELF